MSNNKKSAGTATNKALPPVAVKNKNEKQPSAKVTISNNVVKKENKSSTLLKLPEIKPLKNKKDENLVENTQVIDISINEKTIIPPSVTIEETVEGSPSVLETSIVLSSDPLPVVAQIVETQIILPVNGNGKITLIYEQYNEQFDIVDGITTQENIDEVYCLSFVMPNCLIHLSVHPPDKKRTLEAEGSILDDLFVREDPRGTYHTLEADCTYYVYVEQEADQLMRDQERMRLVVSSMDGGTKIKGDGIVRDDGRVIESCSCIYGNPCVDEYGCKDWSNRAAVALKNGWKGF
jgi:hypothetical protein